MRHRALFPVSLGELPRELCHFLNAIARVIVGDADVGGLVNHLRHGAPREFPSKQRSMQFDQEAMR